MASSLPSINDDSLQDDARFVPFKTVDRQRPRRNHVHSRALISRPTADDEAPLHVQWCHLLPAATTSSAVVMKRKTHSQLLNTPPFSTQHVWAGDEISSEGETVCWNLSWALTHVCLEGRTAEGTVGSVAPLTELHAVVLMLSPCSLLRDWFQIPSWPQKQPTRTEQIWSSGPHSHRDVWERLCRQVHKGSSFVSDLFP